MKLNEMNKTAYVDHLYKMPSDETILRETRWNGGDFAKLKLGYAALWKTRHSLHRQSLVEVA
jgi:hypothetical protein